MPGVQPSKFLCSLPDTSPIRESSSGLKIFPERRSYSACYSVKTERDSGTNLQAWNLPSSALQSMLDRQGEYVDPHQAEPNREQTQSPVPPSKTATRNVSVTSSLVENMSSWPSFNISNCRTTPSLSGPQLEPLEQKHFFPFGSNSAGSRSASSSHLKRPHPLRRIPGYVQRSRHQSNLSCEISARAGGNSCGCITMGSS